MSSGPFLLKPNVLGLSSTAKRKGGAPGGTPSRSLAAGSPWRFGLLVLATVLAGQAVATDAPNDLAPIQAGSELDYPPFCIVREDGSADGFSVELLRAALRVMGRDVTFRTGPWAEVKQWLERGDVEALPLVGRTPEREALFEFTFPYLTMHGAIVVREDATDIRDIRDLRGRRVAVMQGDNAEEFLRREDRGIDIVATPTFTDALHHLAEGRVEAVVIQRLVALRLLAETGLTHLRILPNPISEFRQDFSFAVRAGDRTTLALLNEGLALVIADGTYRRLHAKWFAALELPPDRPILVGGDHHYPPFQYLDEEGRPTGFAVELTRAIAHEAGLDVRIQLGPWAQTVDALHRGDIDAIQSMPYSHDRDVALDFSPRYLVVHGVSVVRQGERSPPTTISELEGLDLVVRAGDAVLEELRARGINARVTLVETQEDVVRAVAEGRHDCGLTARMPALYAIQEDLKEILQNCGRTTSLTHQLLAFARKETIAPKTLDLNDEVGNMLKMMRRLIGEDIDLAWMPGPNLWVIDMDPGQLNQILANLCVNARDAISDVGKITIETENTTLPADYCATHADAVPGDYVLLSVSDDGCGMSKEVLANAFEPFFTTKGVGEGTGLGLATVYGIVRQNSGFIHVYSEPGQGTTFRVYFPRTETGAVETSDDVAVEPAPRGTETILLVEDDAAVRKTTALFLESLGYTVLTAEAPEEARRRSEEHAGHIDLLLTDVVMPGMNGRELAGIIAAARPATHVLYMSGYTADVIAHRGILDDGVSFLAKPFSRDVLARKVRDVLGQ